MVLRFFFLFCFCLPYTWYLYFLTPNYYCYYFYEYHVMMFLDSLLTAWGALMTPVLYPNCREPITAVPTLISSGNVNFCKTTERKEEEDQSVKRPV